MKSQYLLFFTVFAITIVHTTATFTVPQAFLDRKMRSQVYKEFMKMFASAFGPRSLAPYRKEDVKSLILQMEQFLDQSPELNDIVGDVRGGEVRYFADALRDVQAITQDDIMYLYAEHQDWKRNTHGRLERGLGISNISSETALDRLLLKLWGDILERVHGQQQHQQEQHQQPPQHSPPPRQD